MMRDKDDLYNEYVECYSKGKDVHRLKFPDTSPKDVIETLEVFKLKQGLPVKYISTKEPFNLPMDDQMLGKDGFYMKHKGFYLIPNDYRGKIISFVVRGLTHDYHDVFGVSNVRPLFGWNTFEDYKKGTAIIITEGVKDCIILQQFYPYTLALLTAGITIANVNILKALTNKIILAYDHDKTGSKSTQDDIKKLKKKGLQVQTICPQGKDFGEDYLDDTYIDDLIQDRLQKFSKLGNLILSD